MSMLRKKSMIKGLAPTKTVAVFANLALALIAIPLAAQDNANPLVIVRERNEAVKQMLDAAGDPVSDETREELKGAINSLIDFGELSERALRKHWEPLTPEQQADFVDVFRELVRNSSVQKLGIYRADSISYEASETDGDETRVVTVAHKDKNQVEIVYHMHMTEAGWKAFDFVIDGSSTLRTYQDSFQREIAATSYGAMYGRLVDKLEEQRTTGG